jgi:hypothetical protein
MIGAFIVIVDVGLKGVPRKREFIFTTKRNGNSSLPPKSICLPSIASNAAMTRMGKAALPSNTM